MLATIGVALYNRPIKTKKQKLLHLREAVSSWSQAWAAMRSQAAVPVALAWCSETAFCLALGRAGGPETCSVIAGVLHSQDASHPPTCECIDFSQP